MARFIIGNYGYTDNNASSKAPKDAEIILGGAGFRKIVLSDYSHGHFSRRSEICKRLLRYDFHRTESGRNYYVIEFPDFSFALNWLISKIRHSDSSAIIILLIHDINFLRITEGSRRYRQYRKSELRILEKADYLITHNKAMSNVLNKNNVDVKCIELGIFDYLYQGKIKSPLYSSYPEIIVAGNLSENKAGYLYDDSLQLCNCQINAYGNGYSKGSDFVEYKGVYPPEQLIQNLEGQFGLIWDGTSPDSCDGPFGNYLRYNNPHKFSLYIAAGLPIIVWKESALADFVQREHLGLCIGSLHELDDIPANVSSSEYNYYIENVNRIRAKVVNGRFLLDAVNQILAESD